MSTTALSMNLASPQGNLEAYIQAAQQMPILDAEEERDLARRYRDQEDLAAARQLILSQLRHVIQIARGYSGYGLAQGDLIQEGNIGLMKAVKRFDPEQGVRLVSFAVHWIRAEIHEFILKNWKIVKVATTKAQRKLFFNLRKNRKHLGWLKQDEVEQMAEDLAVKPQTVREMEQRMTAQDASFDGYDDDSDAFNPAPVAYLGDSSQDPARLLEQSDWRQNSLDRLADALDELDERSRHILERRWLAENKATLQELANHYGVSAERIRQLEKGAIKKLQQAML